MPSHWLAGTKLRLAPHDLFPLAIGQSRSSNAENASLSACRHTQCSKEKARWVRAEVKREGKGPNAATTLERNSAQLGTGRSQNKKLLVRGVVDADSEERRQAGKGLSSLGVQSGGMMEMMYQRRNLGHRKCPVFILFFNSTRAEGRFLGGCVGEKGPFIAHKPRELNRIPVRVMRVSSTVLYQGKKR